MKVRFWGVRGSFATPGPMFLRYGGHTTAVELSNNAGQRLLIDVGTGATELAKELMAKEFGSGDGFLPILFPTLTSITFKGFRFSRRSSSRETRSSSWAHSQPT